MPTVDEAEVRAAVAARLQETADPDGRAQPSGGPAASPTEGHETSDPSDTSTRDDDPDGGDSDDEGSLTDRRTRPFIKITPARQQVTPGHVVKALYGLYRAGSGHRVPFGLDRRLSVLNTQLTFEFLIHKPRATQRFDFYLGVRPYEREAFEHLAANVRAMYPESFGFEIVPFAVADVFDPAADLPPAADALAAFEGLDDLGQLDGFELTEFDTVTTAPVPDSVDTEPALARWGGTETKHNDWMTLLSRFSELALDGDDGYRSPLSVLLEQALGTDEPFVYQVVFSPRRDWTREAEHHKRNLKMGTTGMWSAFRQEFASVLLGTSEEERRQRHRPDTPEQIGGTISGPDATGQSTQHGRMGQIDLKQPAVTFDVSLRAAGDETVINGLTGAFTALSGPYYGIEGTALGTDDREYRCLTEATLGRTGFRDRFGDVTPVLVASPDELANFVTVPHTGALPKPSRGASGGTPDVRSPLTATDEELLARFDSGMCIGEAETETRDRPNVPIRLTAEQLTHHVLRASTTGSGKTTAMLNDALTAYETLDGPIVVFDKKGGSMASEYKRAHFHRFGDLDDIVHLPVPGPNGELPAFPFFDIRPQLAAGVSREAAVQEKVDRYNELLTYVLGEEQHNQAFVAQEILSNLIVALFDPVYGEDAYAISDLLAAATRMQTDQVVPDVSDPELHATLTRHFSAEERRFVTSIDAVLNRITKLRERDFIWRMLNFVPEWDGAADRYADDQMLFDLDALFDSRKVVLIDTGDLRPASSNLFTVLVLDYLWSWVRLRKRWNREVPGPADGYCVNLIIDEAAPILKASLVREEMIPDAREFALAFEVIVHFPEQVKRDAFDTRAYKEILRNINTKLIGKLAVDDELATTLFHEELDAEALATRVASLPRGEWLAQLPDTGFMTDTPELVTLKPLPIPPGHSDSGDPVGPGTYRLGGAGEGQTYQEADHLQWSRTRFTYCLLPGVNCPPDAAQRAARWGAGVTNTGVGEEDSASGVEQTESEVDGDAAGPQGDPDTGSTKSQLGHRETEDSTGERGDRPRSGGASNEYGTVLGTRTTPLGEDSGRADGDSPNSADDDTSTGDGEDTPPPTDDPNQPDVELTDGERQFLRTVVQALNGELDGYDLTQSMTSLRGAAGSDVDISKLETEGLLETQRVRGRKYYYVTPAGQTVVDRTLNRGRNTGDPYEKTRHKVCVEYLKRYIERQGFIVETYYEPMGGGIIYDVAAFLEREDGTRRLRTVGEVVTNIRPDLVVKHYDDMARTEGVLKLWVVQNSGAAHELVRTLEQAGRVEEVPYKSVRNYETISEETFGDLTEWRIVGATNLIDAVNAHTAGEDVS
jgi:hypothetical protein